MSPPDPAAILDAVSQSLSIGDGPLRFFQAIADPAEPYELGVALTLDAGAALVSYNPRSRGASRGRMLGALAASGLDPRPAAAAFARIPAARSSTVLGLEWRAGEARPAATVYLEELARRAPPGVAAGDIRALAALIGVDIGPEIGRPGPLYILAIDLGPGGASALKVYREAGPDHAPAVRADLSRFIGRPPTPSPLFGGAETSGYIVQRRYSPSGAPAHKIYKCYPYLRPGASLDTARAEIAGCMGGPPPASLGGCPPTSLGLRYRAGDSAPIGGTAYWCVRLNR